MAGIRLTLKNEGRVMDTFLLDQPAKGGITASRINNADDAQDDLMVGGDWGTLRNICWWDFYQEVFEHCRSSSTLKSQTSSDKTEGGFWEWTSI